MSETVPLATRVYVSGRAREGAMDALRSLVDNAVGDLAVTFDVGVRDDEFATVTLQPAESAAAGSSADADESAATVEPAGGQAAESPADATGAATDAAAVVDDAGTAGDTADVTAARNLLVEEWGTLHDAFEAGETYVGTLSAWDDDGFDLDVGDGRTVRLPRDGLDLGPGTARQLVERFGLVQHQPLRFVAGDPARLADVERDRLYDWRRGPGRITVNSTTRGGLRATINRAGHAADVVTIERLGLLEQSVVTTEDTDPPGLVAAIGPHLPAEMRCVV